MENNMEQKNRIDWNGPIQIAVVVAVLLGANLPFYFLHRSDLKEMKKEHAEKMEKMDREHWERMQKYEQQSREFWGKWAEDTKDFHGRLSVCEEKVKFVVLK